MDSKANDTPAPNLNNLNISVKSEKNNDYNLTVELQSSTIIFSLASNNLPSTLYEKQFSYDNFKEIKYFSAFFENINDIFTDICDLIKQNLLIIKENKSSLLLVINLPMKKLGQLNFEIPEKEKDQKTINKELIREINNLQNKVKFLEKQVSILNLITTDEDKKIVEKLIGEKELKFELIYKRRLHGVMLPNFHALVDDSGPSVTFILTKKGKKFGAYTSLGYDSKSEWKKDEKAFIFSVDLKKKYPFNNSDSYGVYCNSSYGIYFGNSSFNIKDLNNGSLSDAYSYSINYELNGGENSFQVDDIEIYKIIE